jgi:ribose/xylose/arabinose/galactoside ABC-type transport system permease subunit
VNAGGLPDLALRHGFLIVLVALLLGFTPHFASLANLLAILHTMAPLVVMSAGLALVVLAGKLDISVGSVAFLSSTVAVLLMNRVGAPPILAFAAAIVCGVALGALNGFIVVVLGVNSLIATLGTMIALRGVGLEATNATMIPLPESVRELGNVAVGPIFVDVLIAAALVALVDTAHRHTVFGRQLNAIGNGEEIAARIGLKVRPLVFSLFVLSGLLASIGGLMSLV